MAGFHGWYSPWRVSPPAEPKDTKDVSGADTRTTVTTPTPGAGRECPYCGMVWGHRRDCAVKR